MNLILAYAVFAEKRGRGAGSKPILFGILERHGKVSEIVPDASRKQLQSCDSGSGSPEASSTRTVGEATMGWWTWATKSISGCIMASMSLPVIIAISMALSHSGPRTIERWKKSILRYVSSYVKKVETQTRRQPSLKVKASREPQNPVWNQGSMEASSLKEEKISLSIQ